ncbi:MAG TPA: beta-N-acetylhexosaminidase, partial [Pyrinomonadaceae bacterium]|nr:beta-N-acetylhexosaminidase [Pyrinomonadaceae bacterium]
MSNTLARRGLVRLAAVVLIVVAAGSSTLSQESVQIQIIPAPQQLTIKSGNFKIRRATRIALADSTSKDDRFAAEDFAGDLKESAKVDLKITKGRSSNSILIGKLSLPIIQATLKQMAIPVPPQLDPEGYVLAVSDKQVIIAGASEAGTFYGLQTLKQLVRGEGVDASIAGVEIVDWPAMRWRGVSDDVSRGPVPTVEYIKRQLRTFAAFKLNLHSFYMEQTFGGTAHPLIGPEGGSLTPS